MYLLLFSNRRDGSALLARMHEETELKPLVVMLATTDLSSGSILQNGIRGVEVLKTRPYSITMVA